LVVDCLDLLDRPQQELILGYLEDSLIRKPGSLRWRKGDIRLIFCLCLGTHRDTGAVHEELERKLAENALHIPPLRERREDVGPLFEHFVIEAARECGRMKAQTVSADAIEFLSSLELSDNAWTLRHAARVCAHLYPDNSIDRECLLVAMQEGLRPLT
jgi:DNA-binding NtrC family response regulator